MKNDINKIEIVGAGVVENSEGKILLAKSPKWHDKWTMPGGHIDPGETIEGAMVREIKEEVGLNVKSQGIVSFGELINSKDFYRPAHFIYFDVLCKTIDEAEVKMDNDEIIGYKWVTPEEGLAMDLGETYDKTILDYIKFKKGN
jgi:nucleoside triphosphatase